MADVDPEHQAGRAEDGEEGEEDPDGEGGRHAVSRRILSGLGTALSDPGREKVVWREGW
jgi:hypothetical protein